jgi:hypothetical protein
MFSLSNNHFISESNILRYYWSMMENSEKKAHHSQERVKSTEKRSSRSFKSFASTVAATERMKRTSGLERHKQESGQEREGRSHSKDNRASVQHTGEQEFHNIFLYKIRSVKISK